MRYNITKKLNKRKSCISILCNIITRVNKYIYTQRKRNMKNYKYKIDIKRNILQITLYKYLIKYTTQENDIQQNNIYTYTI